MAPVSPVTILYRFATDQHIPDLGVDVGGAFGTR
jgi:hypothetical protein